MTDQIKSKLLLFPKCQWHSEGLPLPLFWSVCSRLKFWKAHEDRHGCFKKTMHLPKRSKHEKSIFPKAVDRRPYKNDKWFPQLYAIFHSSLRYVINYVSLCHCVSTRSQALSCPMQKEFAGNAKNKFYFVLGNFPIFVCMYVCHVCMYECM